VSHPPATESVGWSSPQQPLFHTTVTNSLCRSLPWLESVDDHNDVRILTSGVNFPSNAWPNN
jgi:hypothetical protein